MPACALPYIFLLFSCQEPSFFYSRARFAAPKLRFAILGALSEYVFLSRRVKCPALFRGPASPAVNPIGSNGESATLPKTSRSCQSIRVRKRCRIFTFLSAYSSYCQITAFRHLVWAEREAPKAGNGRIKVSSRMDPRRRSGGAPQPPRRGRGGDRVLPPGQRWCGIPGVWSAGHGGKAQGTRPVVPGKRLSSRPRGRTAPWLQPEGGR